MKKINILLIASTVVVLLAVSGYLFLQIDREKTNDSLKGQFTKFNSSELGIEFSYPVGPEGYILEEMNWTDNNPNYIRTIILMRSEDKAKEMPVGGEGPPTITINIFKNPLRQWPQIWADSNIQYSNIDLKIGDILETAVGGAKTVRYMAGGLYSSDNAVVAHGDSIFVFTGMFLDENSDIKKDFEPILNSVNFIKKLGEE